MLDIRECWLTTDLGNSIRDAVREWAREELLTAYDQTEHTGFLRHLVVREGRNTDQALVMLVTAPGQFDPDGLIATLKQFPQVRSLHHAVNERHAEVTNLPSTVLWGEEAIEEQFLGPGSACGRTRSCRRTRAWPSVSTSWRSSTPA